MPECKLPQLPDRLPVKLSLSILPDQHQRLTDYAAFYKEAYGRDEAVCDLIPAMLHAFMDSDRAFMRRRTPS